MLQHMHWPLRLCLRRNWELPWGVCSRHCMSSPDRKFLRWFRLILKSKWRHRYRKVKEPFSLSLGLFMELGRPLLAPGSIWRHEMTTHHGTHPSRFWLSITLKQKWTFLKILRRVWVMTPFMNIFDVRGSNLSRECSEVARDFTQSLLVNAGIVP
jgi:hypothetical protein